MRQFFLLLSLSFLSSAAFSQISKDIPVINGKMGADIANEKIVVKEPKISFSSTEKQAFSVVDGIVRQVSNFNVVIESNGLFYIYQDVRGNADLVNKEIRRGDEIGTMYFNDDKKSYSLYIAVVQPPKHYLPYKEIVELLSK